MTTPNLEVFRLGKLIADVLLWLFGSAVVLWACFGVFVPIIYGAFWSTAEYHHYIHRLKLEEAARSDVYGWMGPGDQYTNVRALSRDLIRPVDPVLRPDPTRHATSNTVAQVESIVLKKMDDVNIYYERDWKGLQIDLMSIALLRINTMLPIFLGVLPIWIGCFFAGEFAARRRFEDSFQPSSNRTKFWFQYVRFMPVAAITLPVVFVSFPVMWAFMLVVMVECYALYKMRSESMEFV